MPPCLIRKGDGASLYATRDLASAIYRMEELKADENLYVVGGDQSLHFKQVFKVLEKMGYAWASRCHHIGFGLVRFKDAGKISSRKGNIIRFSDLIDRAYEQVLKIMAEKNPALSESQRAEVAEQVAVGAITFNDLVNDRVKDVEFDWDRALSFEGDSGPYVQYCHVRCESILRKAAGESREIKAIPTSDEENDLIKKLSEYDMVLFNAYRTFRPNVVANYLLDVCAVFNRFYNIHRILGGEADLVGARLALVDATRVVLKAGLGVLNIKAPSVM
jgi:arginyl-tRNA synthetase